MSVKRKFTRNKMRDEIKHRQSDFRKSQKYNSFQEDVQLEFAKIKKRLKY